MTTGDGQKPTRADLARWLWEAARRWSRATRELPSIEATFASECLLEYLEAARHAAREGE